MADENSRLTIVNPNNIFKPDKNIYKLRDTLREIYTFMKELDERIKKLETASLTR